jgi:hypothetical protein
VCRRLKDTVPVKNRLWQRVEFWQDIPCFNSSGPRNSRNPEQGQRLDAGVGRSAGRFGRASMLTPSSVSCGGWKDMVDFFGRLVIGGASEQQVAIAGKLVGPLGCLFSMLVFLRQFAMLLCAMLLCAVLHRWVSHHSCRGHLLPVWRSSVSSILPGFWAVVTNSLLGSANFFLLDKCKDFGLGSFPNRLLCCLLS